MIHSQTEIDLFYRYNRDFGHHFPLLYSFSGMPVGNINAISSISVPSNSPFTFRGGANFETRLITDCFINIASGNKISVEKMKIKGPAVGKIEYDIYVCYIIGRNKKESYEDLGDIFEDLVVTAIIEASRDA